MNKKTYGNSFTKRIILLVAIAWFYPIHGISEELRTGVSFHSGAEPIDHRTSLSLFEENSEKFEDSFAIGFDLSIGDTKQFGYVLRVIDDENREVNLIFVNFRGEDDLYLDFHSPVTRNSVSIPIKREDLTEKRWLNLKLQFDLKSDKASISLKDTTYLCEAVGFKNPAYLKFVYGLYGLNLDVPQMAVRNIQIEEKQKPKYRFPLNEFEGTDVHDDKGRRYGQIKNPNWIINHHFRWKKNIAFYSECTAGVAYDDVLNRIFVVNKDSVSICYPQYNRKEDRHVQKKIPFTVYSGEAIYNKEQDKCYVYNLDQSDTLASSMAIIDMNDYSVRLAAPVSKNAFHHHCVFWGKEKKNPYIFGGYGKYSYSDKMYRYNLEEDRWENIPLGGDKITPRFFSAAGPGADSSEVLIFGGFGNESGKQEYGGRNFYDLYSLNLQSMQVKKMWKIQDPPTAFVPCGNLILNKEQTHFFTLCYPHHLPNTSLCLYKFSLLDGSYEIVSDSIPFLSEKINTTVYLFYNKQIEEFYAVIREFVNDGNSEVRIYSLWAPPISRAEMQSPVAASPFNFGWPVVSALLILVALLLLALKKKFFTPEEVLRNRIPVAENTVPSATGKKTSVYLLGDFTVYGAKGTDISYRFSSKLKSIFVLILLNSLDEPGISTDMLTMELWPDKDVNSAKNIRGVTVNRLRNILSDMTGISLIHLNSKWFFTFDDSFYCDYIESFRIIHRKDKQSTDYENVMNELLDIQRRGALLPNLQEEWVDSYKRTYENRLEEIFKEYIHTLYANKKYAQLIHFSEVYFAIDPLNEEILDLCLKAFRKIGKPEQGLALSNKFAANYKISMGEDWKGR